MKPFQAIAAMAENRVIGAGNRIPWHLPDDFKWFKAKTMGQVLVMGRKTYDSIGRPLPKRQNIVVSRQADLHIAGCIVVHSLEAALALAWETDEEPRVIGGATLYAQALPQATKLFLTEVQQTIEDGDTFFPEWNPDDWTECARTDGDGVVFLELERTRT